MSVGFLKKRVWDKFPKYFFRGSAGQKQLKNRECGTLALLALTSFSLFFGKDRIRMHKKKSSVSAVYVFGYDLPDVKVFLEGSGTLYTFHGIYDGSRSVSSKLLKLMEKDEADRKGADKS